MSPRKGVRTILKKGDPFPGLVACDETVQGRHGAIPIRRYLPQQAPAKELEPLIWVHGGAFSGGDLNMPESHGVACSIAGTGREVVAVDYRRVPPWSWFRKPQRGTLDGVRFPVPLEDILDVFDAVARSAPRGGVTLGGASAGACLSAAATLRLRDEGRPGPNRLVLAYGTFHASLPAIPRHVAARIRGRYGLAQFRPDTVLKMNHNYAGSFDAMLHAHAFPGGAELVGLPPTLMVDADRDSLRASGAAFASELRAASVPVDYEIIPETGHGFLNRPGTDGFSRGIAQLTQWLDRTEGTIHSNHAPKGP